MINVDELYQEKNLDPNWDLKKISYNLKDYPWPDLFLEQVQKVLPSIDDLTLLHKYANTNQMIAIRKHLESWSRSQEFCTLVDNFVTPIVKEKYPHDDWMVQFTPGIRLMVPDQAKKNRLLPFHTGFWTGYDNGTATIWTPVTDAYDTNTMWIMGWNESRDLMKKIHNESWSMDQIQKTCEQMSKPVQVNVGESQLFSQGHLHGNVNNETGKSRLSFDVRITNPNIEYRRRRPGSYYRFPNTHPKIDPSKIDLDRSWLAFVSPNDPYIDMAPYFMIREFLLQWCTSHGIKPNDWTNELHECDWMPMLGDRLKPGTGIVMASIYNFSISTQKRIEWFHYAVENDVQMIFVDENILLQNQEDIKLIERYYAHYYHKYS